MRFVCSSHTFRTICLSVATFLAAGEAFLAAVVFLAGATLSVAAARFFGCLLLGGMQAAKEQSAVGRGARKWRKSVTTKSAFHRSFTGVRY